MCAFCDEKWKPPKRKHQIHKEGQHLKRQRVLAALRLTNRAGNQSSVYRYIRVFFAAVTSEPNHNRRTIKNGPARPLSLFRWNRLDGVGEILIDGKITSSISRGLARGICAKMVAIPPVPARPYRSRNKSATAVGVDVLQHIFDATCAKGAFIGAHARNR